MNKGVIFKTNIFSGPETDITGHPTPGCSPVGRVIDFGVSASQMQISLNFSKPILVIRPGPASVSESYSLELNILNWLVKTTHATDQCF